MARDTRRNRADAATIDSKGRDRSPVDACLPLSAYFNMRLCISAYSVLGLGRTGYCAAGRLCSTHRCSNSSPEARAIAYSTTFCKARRIASAWVFRRSERVISVLEDMRKYEHTLGRARVDLRCSGACIRRHRASDALLHVRWTTCKEA